MGSLYNLISSATNLTILKGIIDDHSDLKTLLEDVTDLTLFAPTDEAFGKLPDGVLSNKTLMEAYVYNLIFSGKKLAEDITNGMKLINMLDDEKTITIESGGGVKLDNATILIVDIVSDNNQVMHIIDTVLTTKSSQWGLVGAFSGWGTEPDVRFYFNENNVLEIKNFTLHNDSEIKFRKLRDWEKDDLGDDRPTIDGELVSDDGDTNIPLRKGKYNIKLYPEKANNALVGPDYEIKLSYSNKDLIFMIETIRRNNENFKIKLNSINSVYDLLTIYDLSIM